MALRGPGLELHSAAMQRDELMALLDSVAAGTTRTEDAVDRLADLPFVDTPYARIDTHRSLRLGVPEVIFGLRKTPEQVVGIGNELLKRGQRVLVTRVEADAVEPALAAWPGAVWHEAARCLVAVPAGAPEQTPRGRVLVLSAGTSDIPVAEEARVTAETFGNGVDALYDCGVAGIHRLLAARERINAARVVIVVAGMEGALASVVGGFCSRPIIAVPTSIGYGASLGGIAALLAMLNSCSAGVTVVNIDNGFGAAYAATMINRLGEPEA